LVSCYLMPNSHCPHDTTRQCCLCRVWRGGVNWTVALNVISRSLPWLSPHPQVPSPGNYSYDVGRDGLSATPGTHPFNGPFSGTTRVSRYRKGETNLDFTEARDSEWQWHQLGHMQICTWFQTDNHASTPPLSFLQAGCPSCRPTNSVKALTPPWK